MENKQIIEGVESKVDFCIQLTIDNKFTSREEMHAWVHGETEKLEFIVIVAKSDNTGNNRKVFVAMG
jgi:hypothetical protein